MQVILEQIKYRNFLGTGNVPIIINLNNDRTTLVVGQNGFGKSSMLDAITYALFGKSFRKVNKDQLINSINGKNMLCEIEFRISTTKYKVIRGQKPNIFQIYKDNNLIPEIVGDYQKILEQIIHLNYRTFIQVVILGSSSFVPFMRLPAASRREIIEDILDIRIFSLMNGLLKPKIQLTNEECQQIETDIILSKLTIDHQTKLIKSLVDNKKDNVKNLLDKIEENNKEIDQVNEQKQQLSFDIGELSILQVGHKILSKEISTLKSEKQKKELEHEHLEQHILFFEENKSCPSCEQKITSKHRTQILDNLQNNIILLKSSINEQNDKIEDCIKQMDVISKQIDEHSDKMIEISTLHQRTSTLEKFNQRLAQDIEKIKKDTSNINEEKQKIKELANLAIEKIDRKNYLLEQKNLEEIATILLKDSGIKTTIIKKYLPVLNKLINKYLMDLDFYVNFELDEVFSETIKSRFRDIFSYELFSEGEKLRIDIAILFAFRQIAKMKNSVNINIIMMDEIFDSSLDNTGIELFLNLMNNLGEETNVFIISHRQGDTMGDKFSRVIKFAKQSDFTGDPTRRGIKKLVFTIEYILQIDSEHGIGNLGVDEILDNMRASGEANIIKVTLEDDYDEEK